MPTGANSNKLETWVDRGKTLATKALAQKQGRF